MNVPDISKNDIRKAQESDALWNSIRKELLKARHSRTIKNIHLYCIHDGLVCFQGVTVPGQDKGDISKRIVVPKSIRDDLIY